MKWTATSGSVNTVISTCFVPGSVIGGVRTISSWEHTQVSTWRLERWGVNLLGLGSQISSSFWKSLFLPTFSTPANLQIGTPLCKISEICPTISHNYEHRFGPPSSYP